MAGRIRSIKPEWLDDEKLCSCSAEARLLSVALLLLADDYGNGRAHPALIAGHVFNGSGDPCVATRAMGELAAIGYVDLYQVRGQDYFSVRNWAKHQKVDKPGKPRVPPPSDALAAAQAVPPKAVYFILGAATGLIKIGESVDPVARLTELAKCGSEALHLLAVVANGSRTERELHAKLSGSRVHGEWFRASDDVLAELAACGGDVSSPLATAGYDGRNRTIESVANSSRESRESIAPDLRSPISDLRPPIADLDGSRGLAEGGGGPSPDVAAPMPAGNPEQTGTPADIRATPRGNPPPQSAQDAPTESPTPREPYPDPKTIPGASSREQTGTARVLPGFGQAVTPEQVLVELRRHDQLAGVVTSVRHAPKTLAKWAADRSLTLAQVSEAIGYVASVMADDETPSATMGRLVGNIRKVSAWERTTRDQRQEPPTPTRPKLPPGTGRTPDPMPMPTKAPPDLEAQAQADSLLRGLGVVLAPKVAPKAPAEPKALHVVSQAPAGPNAPTALGDLLGSFTRRAAGDA